MPPPHAGPEGGATVEVAVWDLPLRIFHWALVLLVGAAIATGLAGGAWMAWHARAGEAIAALLVFRLAWGLWGTRYARFVQFWPSRRRVSAYLRGRWQGLGHNPLGALSVLAVLGLLITQVATGLLGNDEIGFVGPLAAWVEEETSLRLTGWHRIAAQVLYGWLALHVVAIGVYVLVRRQPLLRAMWRGRRHGPPAAGAEPTHWPLAALSLAVAALAWGALALAGA
jgi:cytochrome b